MTLTYRGHPAVTKAMFVQDMADHAAADRLISGAYSVGRGAKWLGCAVGCGIHTINRVTRRGHHHGDHKALADALGWPEWLVHLEDTLFEGLSESQRKAWPERLAQAVPDDADIGQVRVRWLVRVLRAVVLPMAGDSAAIVERVAVGLETGWANDDRAATYAAAHAAWAAARAATYASADAAWDAAARAAYAASYALAYAAAEAAEAAAARAAYAASWVEKDASQSSYATMADLLIAELQAIPDGAAA